MQAERSARGQYQRCNVIDQLTRRLTPLLEKNQFIMADYWAQNADASHFMQVRDYCYYTPDMPYKSLPDSPTALRYARQRGLQPAYYLVFASHNTTVSADGHGRLIAHNAWGDDWSVELVQYRQVDDSPIRAYKILSPTQ